MQTQSNSPTHKKIDFVYEHTRLKDRIDKLRAEIKASQVQYCWLMEELRLAEKQAHELIILMIGQEEDFDKNMDKVIEIYL